MAELNLDTFGELMDELIKSSHVQLLVDIPAGTIEPTVKENIGGGPVMAFYILLNTIKPIFLEMNEMLELENHEEMLDSLLEIIKHECLEGIAEVEE